MEDKGAIKGQYMKVYIAGKITGEPNYKQKFEAAAQRVQEGGDIPLNPAWQPAGMSNADYMRICFAMIDSADIVWFLDDYTDSQGAQLEHAYCQYISKQTAYGNNFVWC